MSERMIGKRKEAANRLGNYLLGYFWNSSSRKNRADGPFRLTNYLHPSWNDMLLFFLALVQAQIPLLLVISDETIQNKRTQFPNAQATFEQNDDHPQQSGRKGI